MDPIQMDSKIFANFVGDQILLLTARSRSLTRFPTKLTLIKNFFHPYDETNKNIKKKLRILQSTWLFWKCICSKGHICWWIHLSGSCSSHSGMADFKRKGTTSPDTYLLPTLDPIRAYIAICHWISSYILYLQHPFFLVLGWVLNRETAMITKCIFKRSSSHFWRYWFKLDLSMSGSDNW